MGDPPVSAEFPGDLRVTVSDRLLYLTVTVLD